MTPVCDFRFCEVWHPDLLNSNSCHSLSHGNKGNVVHMLQVQIHTQLYTHLQEFGNHCWKLHETLVSELLSFILSVKGMTTSTFVFKTEEGCHICQKLMVKVYFYINMTVLLEEPSAVWWLSEMNMFWFQKFREQELNLLR